MDYSTLFRLKTKKIYISTSTNMKSTHTTNLKCRGGKQPPRGEERGEEGEKGAGQRERERERDGRQSISVGPQRVIPFYLGAALSSSDVDVDVDVAVSLDGQREREETIPLLSPAEFLGVISPRNRVGEGERGGRYSSSAKHPFSLSLLE